MKRMKPKQIPIPTEAAELLLPIRTVSESNQREHWAVSSNRHAIQRFHAKMVTRQAKNLSALPPKPWRITLTRIGKRRLDTGNLSGSMKAVQDGICDALGINDGDEANDWIYHQRIDSTYAVELRIETRKEK